MLEAKVETGIHSDLQAITVYNKADLLSSEQSNLVPVRDDTVLISAMTGTGLPELKQRLKHKVGLQPSSDGILLARFRHIHAIQQAKNHINTAMNLLKGKHHFELIAEELRLAQLALGEITGIVTSDDLLGAIFKSFCIGK